jgi:predicted nucleic acid-binding Zn ribbon protein
MRKSKTEPVGNLVGQYLKFIGLDRKLKEVRMISTWEEVVGKTIAKNTTSLVIQDKILLVAVRSAVVKNELRLMSDQLLQVLNERAGEEIITAIRIR